MWPWEHLAVGYVAYSLGRRVASGRGPTGVECWLLAVGTQLPDLIDKPLAWSLGVLPSGVSLAHSILVAVPALTVAVAAAARRGSRPAGVAFAVGYLSHIVGDGLYPVLLGGTPSVGYALWPLVAGSGAEEPALATVVRLWAEFAVFLGTPRGRLYLALEVGFLGLTVLLWRLDGMPGFGNLQDRLR